MPIHDPSKPLTSAMKQHHQKKKEQEEEEETKNTGLAVIRKKYQFQ